MNDEDSIYYEMLENVHVIFKEEQFNFWRCEIYTQEEFLEAALDLEELLKQSRCRLFVKPELSHITDKELSSRANLPDEQWLTRPEGMSLGEWAQMLQKEREKKGDQ